PDYCVTGSATGPRPDPCSSPSVCWPPRLVSVQVEPAMYRARSCTNKIRATLRDRLRRQGLLRFIERCLPQRCLQEQQQLNLNSSLILIKPAASISDLSHKPASFDDHDNELRQHA